MLINLNRFNEKIGKMLSPRTLEAYDWGLVKFDEWLGKKDIKKLQVLQVTAFTDWLDSRFKSPKSKNLVISAVKKYFNFLYDTGVIENTPFDRIRPFRTRSKAKSLSAEQWQSIVEYSSMNVESDILWLFIIMRFSGLRISEALSLNIKDIKFNDENNYTIFSRVRGKGGEITSAYFVPTKSGGRVEDYLAFKDFIGGREGKLFNKLDRKGVANVAWRVAKKIDVKFSCHWLRHTFAFNLISNGYTPYEIAQFLRHKSTKVTEEVYLKTNETLRDTLMDKVITKR